MVKDTNIFRTTLFLTLYLHQAALGQTEVRISLSLNVRKDSLQFFLCVWEGSIPLNGKWLSVSLFLPSLSLSLWFIG